MENYSAALNNAFFALCDPTRRAIINQLMDGPASVTELFEPFDMGLPSFMKHIKVLEDSDLIASRKTGRVRTCQIKPKQLLAAETWLSRQRVLWEARTDRLAAYAEKIATKERAK